MRNLKLPDFDQCLWCLFFSAPVLMLGPTGLPWFVVSLVFWYSFAWLANLTL